MARPIVSICCLTYNHAPFIRRCLDGFLLQKEVAFEVLIHDDCSTDGTTEIIREYEAKYPDVIIPIYEKENQFSKGLAHQLDFMNYRRARGSYIATCEGDDYWIDPYKLKKQVDFLDMHPDYSVCWHRCKTWFAETNEWLPDRFSEDHTVRVGEGLVVDSQTIFYNWCTKPLSMVFRLSMFSYDWERHFKYYRDTHELYHLLKMGKGYVFDFIGGVYTVHRGGVSSMISREQYCVISLPIDRELYHKTHDEGPKKMYLDTLRMCVLVQRDKNKRKAFKYAFMHFYVSHSIHMLIHNIKVVANII